VRVFLVEDHSVMRAGIRAVLEAEFDVTVVGEAENSDTAIARLREIPCDVVVIDISLTGGNNGIELIKLLRAWAPDLRILVLSMHPEEVYAERAIRGGALGYLSKSAPSEELIRALRTVASGRVFLSSSASQRALRRLVRAEQPGARSPIEQLSDRELEVFSLLGEGVATRDIAGRLHLSVKTVETHRERIKAKLGLRSATELTYRAIRWSVEQVRDPAPPA